MSREDPGPRERIHGRSAGSEEEFTNRRAEPAVWGDGKAGCRSDSGRVGDPDRGFGELRRARALHGEFLLFPGCYCYAC